MTRISFDRVSKTYDAVTPLREVTFTIEPGEFFVLVGPSGCGKSTLVNLLLRFFDPQSGVVRVAGRDIREYGVASLRNAIGYVTQQTMLFNDTIANNIRYGTLDASDEEVEKLVWSQLRTCFDPEIPVNIVELGLVYSVELGRREDGARRVAIRMTLTAPACGMGDILVDDVRSKVERIPTIAEADVELVFDPPWNQSMMSEAARLETGML